MTSRLLACCFAMAVLAVGACSGDDDASDPVPGDAGSDSEPLPDAASEAAAPPKPVAVPAGATCSTDVECGGALECITPDTQAFLTLIGPGYVANGYCARECSLDIPSEQQCSAGTSCVAPTAGAGQGFCFRDCVIGSPFPEDKCGDRTDLACEVIGPDIFDGVCVPTCGGDFECGDRYCDLGSGHCVDARPSGKALGAECASNGECESQLCLEIAGTFFCSGHCVLGLIGCGFNPASPEPLDAACAYGPQEVMSGDRAFCGQLCDCNDDCRHPSMVCDPLPDTHPFTTSARGRRGFCTPLSILPSALQRGLPCGAADGGSEAGPESDASVPDGSTRIDAGSRMDAAPADAADAG